MLSALGSACCCGSTQSGPVAGLNLLLHMMQPCPVLCVHIAPMLSGWLLTIAAGTVIVVAVILPGWYPSQMATGNSTYILEAHKCPQKYIWYVHGVTCMRHSCCPTPWGSKRQSQWPEDSDLVHAVFN